MTDFRLLLLEENLESVFYLLFILSTLKIQRKCQKRILIQCSRREVAALQSVIFGLFDEDQTVQMFSLKF
jgi:hypothetical protein